MRMGMNGLTGPVLVTPTRLLSQPHWKTAVITPKAAAAESRFMTAAVSGDGQAAEHEHQQDEGQGDHHADEQRQLGRQLAGKVDAQGCLRRPTST